MNFVCILIIGSLEEELYMYFPL